MSDRMDVVIAGGSYVGLSLALGLAHSVPGARITIVDPRHWTAQVKDPRASAIAAGARRMLEALGVWPDIEQDAEAIRSMVVTDSRLGDVVRPTFLTFDGGGNEPFAHMVPNGVMIAALGKAAEAAGVIMAAPDSVSDFTIGNNDASVKLASGDVVTARLLVAADGVRSRLRGLAGIEVNTWDYRQSGIVTIIEHERPHDSRAEEHFLPAGPFATLPLKGGHRSSLVWTETTEVADRLVNGDDLVFETELERRLGHHLGALRVAGPRAAYPLGLTLARKMVLPRFALIGDAAHGIHPIAGQGLNLGFSDTAALTEVLANALRLGRDPGSIDVLEDYQRWRRFETWRMAAVTDSLNRLFSNDLTPVRAARDFGLGIVERLPKLKNFFIGAAALRNEKAPRLLRGLPV